MVFVLKEVCQSFRFEEFLINLGGAGKWKLL